VVGRRQIGILAAVVTLSRVVYYALGVRFDTSSLPNAIQLLPEHLLRHDLIRSIWYLHSQPPLFNAFIGVLLHIPVAKAWVFGTTYVLMGFALACTMLLLMVELGTPVRPALIVTSVFIASPITVLYENWLFYSYPVALMLCIAALYFARFARTHRTRDAAMFGVALTLLALSRASFHILFVVCAALSLAFVCARGERRRAVVAALLPLSLVAGLYVKNEIQFGQATSSSWFGMNLAHMVFWREPQVRTDVAAHRLSSDALIVPFVALHNYHGVALPHTGVPALDILSENGHPNFNNRAYIAISNTYLTDTVRFIRRHPGTYLARVGQSYRVAGASAADYLAFAQNRRHIAPLVGLQNRLLGQERDMAPPLSARTLGWGQVSWLVVLQYLAVVGAAVVFGVRALRRLRLTAAQQTFVFIGLTVAYATVAANLLEYGDNNRFRFETDPLVCVASVALVATAIMTSRRRRAATTESDESSAPEEPLQLELDELPVEPVPVGAGYAHAVTRRSLEHRVAGQR
jgi:hypothetical protein